MNHGMYLGIDLGILRDVVNHESGNGYINNQTGEKLVNCRAGDPCPMDRHHPGPVGNRIQSPKVGHLSTPLFCHVGIHLRHVPYIYIYILIGLYCIYWLVYWR